MEEPPDERADKASEQPEREKDAEDAGDATAVGQQLEMSPLTPEMIEAGYISALMDLWLEQQSVGLNPYPHPRGALLRGFLYSLKKQKAKRARETFEDRAIGKLNDGYSPEEYYQLCSRMLCRDASLG